MLWHVDEHFSRTSRRQWGEWCIRAGLEGAGLDECVLVPMVLGRLIAEADSYGDAPTRYDVQDAGWALRSGTAKHAVPG
jgi:hypothetical protein